MCSFISFFPAVQRRPRLSGRLISNRSPRRLLLPLDSPACVRCATRFFPEEVSILPCPLSIVVQGIRAIFTLRYIFVHFREFSLKNHRPMVIDWKINETPDDFSPSKAIEIHLERHVTCLLQNYRSRRVRSYQDKKKSREQHLSGLGYRRTYFP